MNRPLRFLFTTFDGGGNVPPLMTPVTALLARGHAVRVMSDACTRDEIEGTGAQYVPWQVAPNKAQRSRDLDPPDWQMSQVDGLRLMAEFFMGGLSGPYAQDMVAELRREPADLVVNFDMLLGVMAACEAERQAFALLSTCISLFPIPGIPRFGSALPPARTAAEAEALEDVEHALQGAFDAGLPSLNATRGQLGLAPLAHLLDQSLGAQRLFIGTARAFDFPAPACPERFRYIGPLLRDPVWSRSWSAPWAPADTRPLVAVGFSTSFQNHATCLQRIIDACATLPVRVLVTLGGSLRRDELLARDNTFIVDSAPHGEVFPDAAVVVTHGGHGTTLTALRHGVPVLVLPHGRDQGDNAARVHWHGAGLALDKAASTEAIRDAVERLLLEPQFRFAAQKMAFAIQNEIRHSSLIEELEALATSSQKERSCTDISNR
jgi:MGT family glycosyltransferase